MAESFAFDIAGEILRKATELGVEQVCVAAGVYSELEKLKDSLSAVRALLLDADKQQVNDHQITDWLGKLKDCFYYAEDVLDEFGYQSLHLQSLKNQNEGGGGCSISNIKGKVGHFFSTTSNPLAFRFKMGYEIKGIRERLDKIAADAHKFNLKKIAGVPVPGQRPRAQQREMTYSFVRSSDVIGRDDDKRNIIRLLMMQSGRDDDEENVSVLPIVGIGGLGKTALAQLVYNDDRVVEHFQDNRMWVCVSDNDFDVPKLMKDIITSATHNKCDELPADELQRRLRSELTGKKFLLVLDDVWSRNRDKWLHFKALLDVGAKGSKIIVTTRDKLVAHVMGGATYDHPMYELKGLSDQECLSLFTKCAFNDAQDVIRPKLVEIGKEIVRKCQGLPLAVRTLGGMLYLKTDENDWVRVRDSEIWKLKQKEDDILPALKLSYNDLAFDLKQCLASCSLLPKDLVIIDHHLVRMWMGQGLIPPYSEAENKDGEDIGNEYIDELLQISFFQDVKARLDGMRCFRTFKMHDLVHDLASLVARPECCTLTFDSDSISSRVRHVSISETHWPQEEKKVSRFLGKLNNSVRTIVFSDIVVGPRGESFAATCISRFKHIRVLELQGSEFEELPHSIRKLKLLRYLDLSGNTNMKRLPDSICKLHLLQTLMLHGCFTLEEMPRHIGKMMSLRTLTVKSRQAALVHEERSCFNSLSFLSIVECYYMRHLMQGMQSFVALRSLMIHSCPILRSLPKGLPALETLIITDCVSLDLGNVDGEIQRFGRLRILSIRNLPTLKMLPRWLLQGPTSNTLLYLSIQHCDNFKALLVKNESQTLSLTSIETLEILGCPLLSLLPEGMDGLTSLKKLKITNCPRLSVLPEKMRQLSALKHLKIEDCPRLAERCKQGTGDDWNKIAHIHDLCISGPN